MKDTKTVDVSHIKFTSTAFPTDEDMKLWRGLTPEQREAVIIEAEEKGFRSGIAPDEPAEERLARVRAKAVREL